MMAWLLTGGGVPNICPDRVARPVRDPAKLR
jgi:hypothetical protein